jgi:CDP-4-dehydro-6-deoxyglucose reductase, E3
MKISVNSAISFIAEKDRSIFDSALKKGLTFSHSCLQGRCSECSVRVVSGDFELSRTQEGLSAKEIQEGYCLSCITIPLSDMELDRVGFIEGVLPEVRTIPAKISELEFLSADVVKVSLRTPPNKPLKFIAGQYLDLSVRNIKRSYSIASTPSDLVIDLLIKNYPNGQFSNYIFNEAKVNDLLRIEGPKGTYILPNEIPKKLLFVSTGTGIAPNLSLIKSAIQDHKVDKSQITLIHGQRTEIEHVYAPDDDIHGIDFIRTTSRESVLGCFHGYVQDAVKCLDLNLAETIVFSCGNPQMIKDLKSQLILAGLEEMNFKSDVFVPSN